MKQILAVLRPTVYFDLRKKMTEAGFNSMSVYDVTGRGQEAVDMVVYAAGYGTEEHVSKHTFVAKKMIEIYARDKDCDDIVKVIKECAHTGEPGDGKIFILPVDDGVRIRSNEHSDEAIM